MLAHFKPAVTSTPYPFLLSCSPLFSLGLPVRTCDKHHFIPDTAPSTLLNFMLLVITQDSNPLRSLCKTSCSIRESTAPHSPESPANWLRMHSTPPSRSLIKNRTGPGIEPWGKPAETSCHPDSLQLFELYH